ncbi:MAG: molybdate ABC transporter permease subunit [Spirochaetes bacterium]|nr:MAG: molybdate ABC transporter permease subunit [Spirochaetota bacterium]
MDFQSLLLTLKLSMFTTVVLVALAAPLAYFIAFSGMRGKTFIEALIYIPTALPPTVIGFYLLVVMGPHGFAGRAWTSLTGGYLLFTFTGIVIASIVYSIPFAVQPMKAAFQKIDRRLLENAYVLGLTKKAAFFRVVIPNSISGIAAAAVLVFLHSMGAFGVLMMVGGSVPGETRVASIAIYEAVEAMDYRGAGLLSLAFIPMSYAFLLLVNKLNEEKK